MSVPRPSRRQFLAVVLTAVLVRPTAARAHHRPRHKPTYSAEAGVYGTAIYDSSVYG